jgi:hypothetical protein
VVPAPIASVLKHFREEVDAHLLQRQCPAGVCACGTRNSRFTASTLRRS